MRSETDKTKVETFMRALGQRVKGPGRIYLTGGATALLYGWRETTIDIDLKADPEPAGLFEALALLKEELDLNVELAAPDDFIPALPGWRDRSIFISRNGVVDFYHYDPYGQALSKIQRGHERDLIDARFLVERKLVRVERLPEMFAASEGELIRYPALDAASFRRAVMEFCHANE